MNNRSLSLQMVKTLILGGAVLGIGCGDFGGEPIPSDPPAEVNSALLDNALLNAGQFAQAGYALEGRVWKSPNSYVAFFDSPEGARIAMVSTTSGTEPFEPPVERIEGESFVTYAKRLAGGQYRMLERGAAVPPEMLAFAPRERRPDDGVEVAQSALTGSFCPIASYTSTCGLRAGVLRSPSKTIPLALSWNLRDLNTIQTGFARSSGFVAALCGDAGSSDLRIINTAPSFGTAPTTIAVTVNQGVLSGFWGLPATRHVSFCKLRILACIDHDYRQEVQSFITTVQGVPRAGSEYHFCANLATTPASVTTDNDCRVTRTCSFLSVHP
jgi:hypothetical protein